MRRDHHALAAHLAAAAQPFVWGQNDCVLFAAKAIEAQTGADPLRQFGHTWTTHRGALRVLRRLGGLEAAVDTVLTAIAPAMAKRGDIALVRQADGSAALMVVEGDTLVGPDANGVRRLPRTAMVKAWAAA